ncbi:MAG: 4Fe-4S binding protein [Methylococcales symbiont of Hymedesmia sp. n. MRB-2018]|nr:MAG: 4Fe-4S binding protein [Methylococcales symbiont of Hymedesmia sp. n. MRB-2018]
MAIFAKKKQKTIVKYPGIRQLMNGQSAVIHCDKEASDAAASHLSGSAVEMAELWEQQKSNNHLNIADRPLIAVDCEDNASAATATAGLSLSGLRASLFSSTAQSITSMQASLHAAAGKRLPYLLNMSCRSITKATTNSHCSHDDYNSLNNTGFVQLFARNNQSAADLTLIGRKIAELSLNPVAIAQDGILTSHLIEPINAPERELIAEFVGLADDIIDTPTPAQTILYGKTRRRVPETWTVDQAVQTGGSRDSDSYMQTIAGQRPFFFDHVAKITDQCMDEWFDLTGRRYQRINQYLCEDAEYLIFAQGSVLNTTEASANILRAQQIKVGVVDMTLFRPFPGDLISQLCKGLKGILVLERTDQPLSEDLPIIADIRSCMNKAIDNGKSNGSAFSGYASYNKTTDIAPLYSACFGLGGHAIQTGDIIVAVENMLPKSKQQKTFYLGINFVNEQAPSPQQEIQQQAVLEAYSEIKQLSLKTKRIKNPGLSNTFSIRIHSLAGWKGTEAGTNLAQTLFAEFGFDIKANTQQTIEKKGLPTTFYLAADTESVKFEDQYNAINTVIAIDPNVFAYCNPLEALVDNGWFIIQSPLADATAVWQQFPADAQHTIISKQIKVFFIDSIAIAENALNQQNNTDLSFRFDLQNSVFNAVFFKATQFAALVGKTDEDIQSVIDSNSELVALSFTKLTELNVEQMGNATAAVQQLAATSPLLLQQKPANGNAIADIHRFWNQTGSLYSDNHSAKNLADPFIASGIIPASSSIFADMTANRKQHPVWIAENCTACGNCYSVCPDSAIPGLINTVNEVFETNIKRIEKSGRKVKHLRRAIRTAEKKYHALTADKSVGTILDPIFAKAIGDTVKEYAEPEREEVAQEFEWFKEVSDTFKFALTEPYHDEMNNRMPRNGGLFSITINPNSCKGCMECVSVCDTDALVVVEQTQQSNGQLRKNWDYWMDLPTSNKKYSRIDDLHAKKGVLATLLLDKKNYHSLFSNSNSRSGSGEKIAIHLFTSTVTALMQPRIEQHLKHINQLIIDMEKRIRLQLVEALDISDIDALETAIDENHNVDLTLSRLSGALDKDKATQPIDPAWLRFALQLVAKLKNLKWSYNQGLSGEGRAALGLSQSGKQTAWNESFPYNPYPFPWASHLSQDAPALALGLFEGHMVKMAEGFKAIRTAELEIKGKYDKTEHDKFFAYFDWQQFSEEEYLLCPPIVSLTAEGVGFKSGLQNISNSLLSGTPIKILVLDNQRSQPSANLPKELGLIAMAHQTAYVHQGSVANTAHLLENYIDGLNYRGPALWSIYTSNQPEHGLANNSLTAQSKLAVESRAYPLMTFDPRSGKTWEQCINLSANPQLDQDWITYTLDYTDEYGNKFDIDVPLTFADWALTEAKFSSHFKSVAADAHTDNMVLLTDYIESSGNDQVESLPFIWAVHPQSNRLLKVIVSADMVAATQQRRDFWHTLKGLGGNNRVEVDTQAIANQAKAEIAQTITEGLMSMIGGDASALTRILADTAKMATVPIIKATPVLEKQAEKQAENFPEPKKEVLVNTKKADSPKKESAVEPHEPVWIETPDCTTCDECVDIAPAIFQYNAEKKAIVIDPTKGTFEDIVRSAEKCTAVIIHPGTPWNPEEPNLDKLIKRAESFQ